MCLLWMSITAVAYSTSGMSNAFCAGDNGSGFDDNYAYYTYERWHGALSRTGSVKKWDVRRQRGTSSTPSKAIGYVQKKIISF